MILHGSVIQADTIIGKHVLVNTAASIDHENVIGDYAHVSPHATCGRVHVGEGTHIGAVLWFYLI
jgi:acetyltransferase EpsM